MNPLIKWPGGKSGEISTIEKYIPKYNRYIEPFFGGGALFFHLKPNTAAINDISSSLIEYYELVKAQDKELYKLLMCYNNSFTNIIKVCEEYYSEILAIYTEAFVNNGDKNTAVKRLDEFTSSLSEKINSGFDENLLLNEELFTQSINKNVVDKMQRTRKNADKAPFSDEDLKSNLITGFTSGYYMYFRDVFNDINLGRITAPSVPYKAANFYFIREYCYGSMFRYNAKGEFNIPYGGMSYNKKNMKSKIDNMFNKDVSGVFANTEISCLDFEEFFKKTSLKESDFIFLDPPYDTDFSDYEGKDFTKSDQERLADCLKKTAAQFLLVIKNTDFIKSLYEREFNIVSFDKQYTYNVKSRNNREAEHLLITNLPV